MQRCTFCRDEIGTVHWAFDGVSEQPVPACRECCEKLRLKVWKVEAQEPKDMPVRADCMYCGIPLPSADTRPVIVWVRGEHGVDAVCNACRIRYDRATQFVTLPDADWDETDWPQDNAALLRQLLAEGAVDLRRGELFEQPPAPLPAAAAAGASTWDRVEGMLLGIAVGDALGNTTEGMPPADRRAQYGEIRDYVPHWRSKELARPTDDTQMAFWTLDQLLVDRGLVPHRLAQRFASERIFGIGSAVSAAMQAVRLGYRPWYQCGTRSAGNGALMRIAPMLVPYLREPSTDLWADTALSAIVTHNDAASTSACLALVAMLWELLGMEAPPEPVWWRRRYVELARDLEGDTEYEPRGGAWRGQYRGPLWRFVDERLADAEARGLSALEACDEWHSGAYLLETVPSVLYILARHGADPEEAIVRAVNDTKDNDTIAAIVGAAVGALHGASALPARWVAQLPGYTRVSDEGEVQRVIARARERWGSA
jgi:ADP-ribosyl-[dinitrogen reductase] hydrolase